MSSKPIHSPPHLSCVPTSVFHEPSEPTVAWYSCTPSSWRSAQLGEHGQWGQVILKKISHISWDKIFQVVLLTFHVALKLHSILCINLKEKKWTVRPTRTSVVVLWIFWLTMQNLTLFNARKLTAIVPGCVYIYIETGLLMNVLISHTNISPWNSSDYNFQPHLIHQSIDSLSLYPSTLFHLHFHFIFSFPSINWASLVAQ